MLVLNDIFQKTWGWANRSPVYHEPPREEFWQQATHRFPDLVWIAEAYWDTEYRLQQLGFDYVYDKRLYDRLKDSNPHEVYLHLTADVSFQSRLVRYIENHDELRSVLAFGNERVKPAVALMAGLPGLKMYYNGQLEGRKVKIPVQLRQAMREDGDSELFQFYTKLLAATGEPVFHDGSWQLKEVKSDGDAFSSNVIAYTWQLEGRLAFVVANLGAEPTRVIVHFQDQVSESADYDLEERLTGRQCRLNGKILAHPGFRLALPAYGANVFDIMPSSSLRGFILPEGKDAISDGAK
jgi:hypothetical protein